MTTNTKRNQPKTAKPSKMPETISGQLLWHIRNSCLSNKRLHKETGVHNSVLSRFLRGERGLSLESIDAVARHLKLRLIRDEASPERSRRD